MANTLAASLSVSGDFSLVKDATAASSVAQGSIGSNDFPEITHDWEDGTGDGEANEIYIGILTITAGGTTSIDLSGSSYKNPFEENLAFTGLVGFVLKMVDPSSTKSVRVGPQNVSNAAQLWFGDVGATVYEVVYDGVARYRSTGAWTVTGGTGDLLPIHNPGGADVEVAVWIIGTK